MALREKIPYRNHASRHLPGGSDPLAVSGTPAAGGSASGATLTHVLASAGSLSIDTIVPFTSHSVDGTYTVWDSIGYPVIAKAGLYLVAAHMQIAPDSSDGNNATREIPGWIRWQVYAADKATLDSDGSWSSTVIVGSGKNPDDNVSATPCVVPSSKTISLRAFYEVKVSDAYEAAGGMALACNIQTGQVTKDFSLQSPVLSIQRVRDSTSL